MKISETVLELVRHDAEGENWVLNMLIQIEQDDPGFQLLIDQILGNGEECKHFAISAVLIAYRMFETQLEIDQLEDQFNENP